LVAIDSYDTDFFQNIFAYALILAEDIVIQRELGIETPMTYDFYSRAPPTIAWANGLKIYLAHYLVESRDASMVWPNNIGRAVRVAYSLRTPISGEQILTLNQPHTPHAVALMLWRLGAAVGHDTLTAHLNTNWPATSDRNDPGMDIVDFFDSWVDANIDGESAVREVAEIYSFPYVRDSPF